MSQFLGQLLTLLTTSPGNLVYHLVLVFSIAGALQGVTHFLRTGEYPQAKRIVFGLIVLLGLQILLFIFSGLVWSGILNAQAILPPLDRLVTLLSLLWIIWLWAFQTPVRMGDAAIILLSLLGITAFGLNIAFWAQKPSAFFNLTVFETAWQALSLAIILLGLFWLTIRKSEGWTYGLTILLLGVIGHLLSLIFRTEGNFPGFVRLFQLAMFPILLTLSQRFSAPVPTLQQETKPRSPDEPFRERRRYSTDPKTFHSLLSLAAEIDSNKIGQEMTRGIAQAMLADLCFLIILGNDKSLSIACGYDLIREENLGGTGIDRDSVPLLANAIVRGRPLRLQASSTSSDLKGLGKILSLTNPGHLLSVPIISRERGPLGGVMILSPYSNRLWNADDQAYLTNVSTLFLPILERGQRAAALVNERDQSIQTAREANEQKAEAVRERGQLAVELEGLRQKITQTSLQAENMTAVLAMQEENLKNIEQLKTENERLRSLENTPSVANSQMELELRQALEDMAHMQNQLAEANMKVMELEKRPAAPITDEQVEVIASISQELRQPMSSIIGYTDLLMGESVGILGALQRKFIERIKASTERIGGLVDDLIQITNLDTGKLEFKAEPLDLNLIIDNAMAYTSTQIREKNITLRLDLTETAPRIQTDRDALQQILIHLLQNATAATHAEGNITLRVQLQSENGNNFLSIQVTDSGGGIDAEDVPRVFARRYRAEHSLIQGVGDTGVGLSIAKTLVEAQNGRIWVETEAGVGSTFSLLMPVIVESTEENR
jgi:signal transduction histidine kinase